MTEEKKPFTVSDRRHFTAEGETRSQAPEETPAPAPATPPPPPPATKVETAERPTREAAPVPPLSDQRLPPPRPGEEGPSTGGLGGAERAERADDDAPPMDFIGLLVSLATQAGYLMSPEPGSGAPPDLAGARSIIGLLEILKQKTEGRRTPDEDRVLDGLLYELRMAFVSRTRPEKA
jgi:uncharacterized protein DUF1844